MQFYRHLFSIWERHRCRGFIQVAHGDEDLGRAGTER